MPQNAEERIWSRVVWTVLAIVVAIAALGTGAVLWFWFTFVT